MADIIWARVIYFQTNTFIYDFYRKRESRRILTPGWEIKFKSRDEKVNLNPERGGGVSNYVPDNMVPTGTVLIFDVIQIICSNIFPEKQNPQILILILLPKTQDIKVQKKYNKISKKSRTDRYLIPKKRRWMVAVATTTLPKPYKKLPLPFLVSTKPFSGTIEALRIR